MNMNSRKNKQTNNQRGPSPNLRFTNDNSFIPDIRSSEISEDYPGQNPVSINIRNNILDQCNNQYDNSFRNQRDQEFENEEERSDQKKKLKSSYISPYQKDQFSVTPQKTYLNEVDETIQGNIDGQMSDQQIKNKKAYVWAFGKNQEGELALGVYKDAVIPRFVTGMKGFTAKWISSSNHHTAIITEEGQLLVSGSSLHGKLGIEGLNKNNINKLQIVPALQKRKAKQVCCGDYHTICLIEDGTVYQFGGSLFKDKKDKIQRPSSQTVPPSVPQPIQALYGKDIVQIACGDFHSAAIDANGDLYTWGGGAPSYNKGQCGHGHTNITEQPEKVKLLTSKRIIKVACGGFHTLALTSENELYAFGSGNYGECGFGEYMDTSKPKLVKFPNDLSDQRDVTQDLEEYDEEFVLDMYLKEQPIITNIVAGGRHSMVTTNKGRLYTFGYGTNGQLGLKSTSNFAKPQLVKDLEGKMIVQIAAGWNHSLALTDRGDLYACGYGAYGQLGTGDKESKTQFTYIESFANKNIGKIFAGGSHSWVALDKVIPLRDNWRPPSPLKMMSTLENKSFSNTPLRKNDLKNSFIQNNQFAKSANKPIERNHSSNMSPFQNLIDNGQNGYYKQSVTSATFGGLSQSFNKLTPNPKSDKNLHSQTQIGLGSGDDFIQKVLEIQSQQLMKSQYFLQVTYCETEFCHRFVNFEVHEQFVKQFENLLEEYIQLSYQQEKGVLYHKIQEVPKEYYSKKNIPMTTGDRLIKEAQEFDESEFDPDELSDGEDAFKAYTLCLICNPAMCSYDQAFTEWKKNNGITGKQKKVVINSSQFPSSSCGFRAVENDENQVPLIGKIVFLKDSEIKNNEFEEIMSGWMANFHRKLAKYCIKKPRYSELRPMKFSLS